MFASLGAACSIGRAHNELVKLPGSAGPPTSWPRHLVAVFAPAGAVTLIALAPEHPPPAVVAVLYLLAVVVAARIGGAISGSFSAVLSFLALNFFFTSPLHTFAVAEPEDLVTLFVFLVVAVIVGLLLSSLVEAKSKAERREFEARLLNRLATRLLSGEPTEDVLADLAEGIKEHFGFRRCEIHTSFTDRPLVAGDEIEGDPHVFAATARAEQLAEIRVWAADDTGLGSVEHAAMVSLSTQLALALEGMRLSVAVRRAELDAQASRLKAALFSGVTHDVKTPLAAIMASVTSLIDGTGFSDADRSEHLDTIKQEAERLHRVVNNLLDVQRLRAGALVPTKIPSAIDELMESVINRLRPLLEGREIEMRVSDELPDVPIDVVQMDQVMTNLLENAVKFTPAGSPITLSAVGGDHVVRVTVRDRGAGIPAEDRTRIFEPFERGEGAVSGTGLGLAISNAIVVGHGGRMWVSNNATGGASFTFELPVEVPSLDEEVFDAGARSSG